MSITKTPPGGPGTPGKGRPNPGAAEVVATALAAGQTAVAAAAVAGVHERTVRKWLDRPDYRSRVERLHYPTPRGTRKKKITTSASLRTKQPTH